MKAEKNISNKRKLIFKIVIPTAAFLVVIVAVLLFLPNSPDDNTIEFKSPFAVNNVVYPTRTPAPEKADYLSPKGAFDEKAYYEAVELWRSELAARAEFAKTNPLDLTEFYSATIPQMLSSDTNESRVYSPLNLYFALGMLSEVTDGESREQILDLIGESFVSKLRDNIPALWCNNYILDGFTTSIFANSFWLNENIKYNPKTLNRLAKNYYASSFSGEMGSAEYNDVLHDWVNAHTADALTDESSTLSFERQTVLALVSCVDFQVAWKDPFYKTKNIEAFFHTPDGNILCRFMNATMFSKCYDGENFVAASLSFSGNDGKMWFILPDEGFSTDDVTVNPELVSLLTGAESTQKNIKDYLLTISVPKFDVAYTTNLIEELKALGITDILDPDAADFSPLMKNADNIYLDKAQHSARVAIDENGCSAAAYTYLGGGLTGGVPKTEKMTLIFNRPFIFAITSADNSILFIGTLNSPVR